MLDTVEGQYGDLLLPEETGFLEAYRRLGFDAQCLYVRLISRVGPWFRELRLHYPELGAITPAVDDLLQAGLAEQAAGLSVEDLGGLCSVAELSTLYATRAADKASLLQQISQVESSETGALDTLIAADCARVIAPAKTDVVNLLQLLFFGNRRQGLTDFVLSDLGVARYYPYALDRGQRLFPRRETLEAYLDCAACEDQWHVLLEQGDEKGIRELAVAMSCTAIRDPAVQHRWDRLYNRVARQLERMGESQLALTLYSLSQRHPARERSARLFEKVGAHSQAEQLCETIEAQPWCEDERDASRRILPRVRRKLYGGSTSRRRDQFDQFVLSLPHSDVRVERQVAQKLSGDWQQVRYVENQLMTALFGLAFWEQIFAPVPGAFNNPYQSVPADMYEQDFAANRRELLDSRLAELSTLSLDVELPNRWRSYQGFQCRWVNWRVISEELVTNAAAVIPREHLLAIWQRILFDPRENRRGFPDLLALGSRPGDYQMIEVKGPGDTLQDSQKRWLRFFREQGIPAAVAHVQWSDD
ncbi:VRR-NUC domain-containing protein [Pseudohalioglobus lutimaris]|uniref:phosphodiesterase I n=1 Tax=Pseudohalioglobus lutimaris TaxID=1737061 RepID=A0A2N5X3L2_9GAMM|nr:VRR-NUC domain-containing protein [Pseudohalioglobus lutimaris]PLW69086.1 VRR-NUC domain-containing protein [Pseudohalioglobus lutimaris]